MTVIIACSNLKGGIGKTATAHALADIFSENYSVLLVDTDKQESLTEAFGESKPSLVFKQALSRGQLTRLLDSTSADVVIIDTPPAIEGITSHVLQLADGVIIPLVPESPDVRGLLQFLAELRAGPKTEVIGILAVRYEPRLIHHQNAMQDIIDLADENIFKTTIGKSVVFGEASGQKQSVINYAPNHKQALAYKALAKEVESWLKLKEKAQA